MKVHKDKVIGYEYFFDKTHPLAAKSGRVYMHRHVWWLTHGSVKDRSHIHHINGNRSDNRIENLKEVSPQEHGMEHRSEINKGIKEKTCPMCGLEFPSKLFIAKHCSVKCATKSQRRAERPSPSELNVLIQSVGYSATGRMFGVSDNAIRKWQKQNQIQQ